jgi:hypothetical protein
MFCECKKHSFNRYVYKIDGFNTAALTKMIRILSNLVFTASPEYVNFKLLLTVII